MKRPFTIVPMCVIIWASPWVLSEFSSLHFIPQTNQDGGMNCQKIAGGWRTSPWFGSFRPYTGGWLYHADLGWLYSHTGKSRDLGYGMKN